MGRRRRSRVVGRSALALALSCVLVGLTPAGAPARTVEPLPDAQLGPLTPPPLGAASLDAITPAAPADASVGAFGAAGYFGSPRGAQAVTPIVGLATTPFGRGYWVATSSGEVFSFGRARFHGSLGGRRPPSPVVAIVATPTGDGYRLVTARGGVWRFGAAKPRGSASGMDLNAPVVGAAGAPSGQGYWMVTADGGVLAFGSAGFHGSLGGRRIPAPAVGIAVTPSGDGYWIALANGQVKAFGDAKWYGDGRTGSPVVGIARTPGGYGYWLARANGKVAALGNARDLGAADAVASAIAAHPQGQGIWIAHHNTTLRSGDSGPAVSQLQRALVGARFWTRVTGTFDYQTLHAVTAVQKANGLARTGVFDAATRTALVRGAPAPRDRFTDGAEVDLTRQIALIVRDGATQWVFDVSTGKPSTPTRPGRFHINREDPGRTRSCSGCLYRPRYFDGGRAFHGYIEVPPYAASHGCVRMTNEQQDFVYAANLLPMGSAVYVYN